MENIVYKKNTDIIARSIADERILIPIKRKAADLDKIYTLNEIGHLIWKSIDSKQGSLQIVGIIVGEFDIDQQTAERDLNEFLEKLEKAQMIIKV